MSDRSETSIELAIALPLGVVAHQLMKVESDLRLLSAKASADACENAGSSSQIAGRLEKINETLESIRSLIAEMEKALQPASGDAALNHRRDDRDD